eukprot:131787-Prymnesium_polylepis.1
MFAAYLSDERINSQRRPGGTAERLFELRMKWCSESISNPSTPLHSTGNESSSSIFSTFSYW